MQLIDIGLLLYRKIKLMILISKNIVDYEAENYPELPRFGKYKSVELRSKKRSIESQKPTQSLNISRDNTPSDRYRDYSPGEVQIRTPNILYPNFTSAPMFQNFSNKQSNKYNAEEISHKYRIDPHLKENKKNTYHMRQNTNPNLSLFQPKSKRHQRHRKIDTSNYIVKSLNASKHTTVILPFDM